MSIKKVYHKPNKSIEVSVFKNNADIIAKFDDYIYIIEQISNLINTCKSENQFKEFVFVPNVELTENSLSLCIKCVNNEYFENTNGEIKIQIKLQNDILSIYGTYEGLKKFMISMNDYFGNYIDKNVKMIEANYDRFIWTVNDSLSLTLLAIN